jgi:hypothetical protein
VMSPGLKRTPGEAIEPRVTDDDVTWSPDDVARHLRASARE